MKISIIMPAYNEESIIKNTLDSYCPQLPKNVEIIIVNDGSKDKTEEIVSEYSRKDKRVNLINQYPNVGKGETIINGFKNSDGDIVGFVDADNSFEVKDAKKLIQELESNKYDCVIGSRWMNHKFKDVSESFIRKLLSRILNGMVRRMFGIRIKDTQAGIKFFKKNVVEVIRNHKFICRGYSFDLELVLLLKNRNFSIKETGVSARHLKGGSLKIFHVFKIFNDLIKLWFLNMLGFIEW